MGFYDTIGKNSSVLPPVRKLQLNDSLAALKYFKIIDLQEFLNNFKCVFLDMEQLSDCFFKQLLVVELIVTTVWQP